ncbi:hypothetical protein SAMN05216551_110175 [Chitinasiproducens palmae]|uniref:Uncharacterized protein n=1 Tax=Chitinasiproducens palmae TaxID=1770053 RepID=A0A1H2PSX8_9BURK|nr:hypothetical protein SAMN05216551_110175 [Chitinasiproducens palmae]
MITQGLSPGVFVQVLGSANNGTYARRHRCRPGSAPDQASPQLSRASRRACVAASPALRDDAATASHAPNTALSMVAACRFQP